MQHGGVSQFPAPAKAPVYFLHIPKTAGTTLIAFLDAQYARGDICPGQLLPELFALDRARVGGYQFYRGHLWHGVERYVGKPLQYLTMLRDPLQRTLSWYLHVRRNPDAYRHARMVSEQWSLLDFVNDPETRWDLLNTQTLFLAADLDFERLAADPVGYGQRTIRAYAERGHDPALLETAKRRLETMQFGIAERMEHSLYLLSHAFGFDPGMPAQRLNVSPNAMAVPDIPADVRAAIEAATSMDRALYAWACERFAERFDAMVHSLVVNEAAREGCVGAAWRTPLQATSLEHIGVESVACSAALVANDTTHVRVTVRNDSDEVLSSRPPHPVHVAYHWVDAGSGETVVHNGERTPLPAVLPAGARLEMSACVRAPEHAGRFRLQVRLVQEGVSWIEHADPGDDPEVVVQAA